MISVFEEIKNRISRYGYLDISTIMSLSMSSFHNSYYRSNMAIGENEDFITAPYSSQMFGEMLALWCVDVWRQMNVQGKFSIIELGAGNGYLMRDILRVIKKVCGQFYDVLEVIIIDINSSLVKSQKKNLVDFESKVTWYQNLSQITQVKNSIILANEFFDAMPINQYYKSTTSWSEIVVKMDPSNYLKFDTMKLHKNFSNVLSFEHPNALDGAIYEESKQTVKIIKDIINKFKNLKFAMLIIDYGYDIQNFSRSHKQYKSTLQAIKNHKYHPILENLGSADITAHVNFDAIKRIVIANFLTSFGSISQKKLLISLGINTRKKILIAKNSVLSNVIENQYDRIVNKMGNSFLCICFSSDKNLRPVGFT